MAYIYCITVSDKIKVTTATLLYVERGSATFQSLSYLDCTSTAVGKYCLSYLDYKMKNSILQ